MRSQSLNDEAVNKNGPLLVQFADALKNTIFAQEVNRPFDERRDAGIIKIRMDECIEYASSLLAEVIRGRANRK